MSKRAVETNRSMVKALCQSIMMRLESQGSIAMVSDRKKEAIDGIYHEISPIILTEEDLRQKTFEELGAVDIEDPGEVLEGSQYRVARGVLRREIGENELNGFYFQRSLRDVSVKIRNFLMKSDTIDEVFDSDEELSLKIISIIRRFNPEHLH